ncbi:sphingosine-1-phosphate phosphatase 1 [Lepisosteus oculatus]|uniref:sphingosine-1-phosphate phosphatase 1 n=1 Tax=Lepisosteus oculatus TaxID=7918 RepID=UPI003711BD85
MATAIKLGLRQLLEYLQDPHKVASFQRICGVRGTFADACSDQTLRNGDCSSHGDSGRNAGKGEPEDGQTGGPRLRAAASPGSTVKRGGAKNGLQNGFAPTPAAAGETAGHAAASDGGDRERLGGTAPGGCSDRPGRKEWVNGEARTKPLRRNSLTGEVGQEFVIENRLLYYLFTFGTELGNELFYITFFPFFIWNIDAYVSRRLIVIWVWVMYLGQCTKDIIRWSRPSSPPVVKVEMFYNSEYSMPSTHAMSGTAIPLGLFLLTYGRWEYPFLLGLASAVCWCSLVCISRIYMGMHSILDVVVGFLYSILILVAFHPALEVIDNFNLTCRYAPLIIISLHLAMGVFSFTLDTWSTSRGDTAQILGTGAGIACASHLNYLLGLMPDPPLTQLPFSPPPLSAALVGRCLVRFVLGVAVLLATRAVMKALTIPLACRLFRIPCHDVRQARQRMEVELPYRYIVYGTVGFNALFLVPFLFSYLNLF